MKSTTLVCVLGLLTISNSRNVENDLCTLSKTQSPGVCILIENCPEAIQDLRNGKYPQTCGFQGIKALVCCSTNITKESKPQDNISKKVKCREYASYVFEIVQIPILPSPSEIKVDRCNHQVVALIVGGTGARHGEFPHMALIGFSSKSNNIEWLCGGSLISEQHILTTATCLNSGEYGLATHVALGMTQISEKETRQEYKVIKRIAHPQYSPRENKKDIGILKLEKLVKINRFIRPACLHTDFNMSEVVAVAVGWEKSTYEDHLFKQGLRFLNPKFCHKPNILDSQICVNPSNSENKDCENFGGAVLHLHHDSKDAHCMYDIVGVTSAKSACMGLTHVYTKVSYYVKWIEKIVWEDSNR